ncbi:MAG: nitroreductase [Thermodesulfovibrionales bacterium]
MDAIECIRTRMSIRKFLQEPVPRDILEKVFDAARWSPSYKNSQPWEVVVVSGRKKEELTALLAGLLDREEPPCPDLEEPVAWPPAVGERIAAHLAARSQATGIDLNDPVIRKKAKLANFRFYGAPHAFYFFQDASLTAWSMLDMGLFCQSVMLAAHSLGLGTVPQAFATDYSRQTREFLGIPDDKRLMLGMSVGYPDLASPANAYRSGRQGVGEIVRWAG